MGPTDYAGSTAHDANERSSGSPSGVQTSNHAAELDPQAHRATHSYPSVDDEELVARCRDGDGDAFRLLFGRYRDELARLVYGMTGRSADLEEILREVILHVYRQCELYRNQFGVVTWLRRVALDVVVMHERAARRRPEGVPWEGEPDVPFAAGPNASRLERHHAFRRLVRRMADKRRVIFLLHDLHGLSSAEISRIVDTSVLVVRTRLFCARRELARRLEEEPCLAEFARDLEKRNDDRANGAR